MEIYRSLGVSRLVALMMAHRHRSDHDRLLNRLDRLVAEARDLCTRAEELCPNGVADAFQVVLARPTQDWMERAETMVESVRPSSDTICGARAEGAPGARRQRQCRHDEDAKRARGMEDVSPVGPGLPKVMTDR